MQFMPLCSVIRTSGFFNKGVIESTPACSSQSFPFGYAVEITAGYLFGTVLPRRKWKESTCAFHVLAVCGVFGEHYPLCEVLTG